MKYLMKTIAEILFWLGDKVSHLVPFCPRVFYPIYNNLMGWSFQIQEKYDLDGPWDRLV